MELKLNGIVVVLEDCEFILSEYMASQKCGLGTQIYFKNGRDFYSSTTKEVLHEAILNSTKPTYFYKAGEVIPK